MKKFLSIGLIATIVIMLQFSLNSCDDDFMDCIDGNGVVDSETRQIIDFDEIGVYGEFDVIFKQDSFHSIEVEAEENLIPYIVTAVSGNKLIVKSLDDRCLRNKKVMRVYVTAPDIDEMALLGSGSIRSEDTIFTENIDLKITGSGNMNILLDAYHLDGTITGSGDMKVSGFGEYTRFVITGSGEMRTLDYLHNYCDIEISGSGDAWIDAAKALDVTILGSGDVFYVGNPSISKKISGSGDLIRI
jgi:hypothetical protein